LINLKIEIIDAEISFNYYCYFIFNSSMILALAYLIFRF